MAIDYLNLHDKKRKTFKITAPNFAKILLKKHGISVKPGDNMTLHIFGENPKYDKFENRQAVNDLKGTATTDERTIFESTKNPVLLEYKTGKTRVEYRYVTHNETLYDLL